jgi:hypothetical protein
MQGLRAGKIGQRMRWQRIVGVEEMGVGAMVRVVFSGGRIDCDGEIVSSSEVRDGVL